jgi:hypothetical protein
MRTEYAGIQPPAQARQWACALFGGSKACTLRREHDGDRQTKYGRAVSVPWRRQREQCSADAEPYGTERERSSAGTECNGREFGSDGGREDGCRVSISRRGRHERGRERKIWHERDGGRGRGQFEQQFQQWGR